MTTAEIPATDLAAPAAAGRRSLWPAALTIYGTALVVLVLFPGGARRAVEDAEPSLVRDAALSVLGVAEDFRRAIGLETLEAALQSLFM